jgi:hypothetical protein
LLNRGDHFAARPLPVEAQFAPVFGIAIGDLDGDSLKRHVHCAKLFGVSRKAARCRMRALPAGRWTQRFQGRAHKGGFAIYGEARGAASLRLDTMAGSMLSLGRTAATLTERHGARFTSTFLARRRIASSGAWLPIFMADD